MSTDPAAIPPDPVREVARLHACGLRYLAQRASTTDNLRRVLERNAKRRHGHDYDVSVPVEATIAGIEVLGLLNDVEYAKVKASSLRRSGASSIKVLSKLALKGVDRNTAKAALAQSPSDEEAAAAAAFARRKRLGVYRAVPDPDRRQKDLGAMARAGFRFDVARRALAGQIEEE